MARLFGTDGVRGAANEKLTPELAFALGKAGATVLTSGGLSPRILVGTDGRVSGGMLGSALCAGMCSVGANPVVAGVIPTPGIAALTVKYGFDAGVVISASHNPYYDNGIKFVSSDGHKLSDETEDAIEALVKEPFGMKRAVMDKIGMITNCDEALADYREMLAASIGGEKLKGLRIALDCANGATHLAAPSLFDELGAEVFVMANEPNGININDDCGSTHPEALRAFVRENECDAGFAFDGDGDRIIAVDENGEIVNGDKIMLIMAKYLKEAGKLTKNTVVATVMSNMGFMKACRELDINVEITRVGDRYVLEKMLQEGYNLGGEESGHIIYLDHATTGDGILAAVQLARMIKSHKLSQLAGLMRVMPQVIVNATVTPEGKTAYAQNDGIMDMINRLEDKYADTGRVLIRPSGTEPYVRVMIEGEDLGVIQADAKALAGYISSVYKG